MFVNSRVESLRSRSATWLYNKAVRPKNGARPQFSITMNAELKTKLEQLAALRGLSLSSLIEELAKREVDSVDKSLWEKIAQLQSQVSGERSKRPFARSGRRA